ncbi:thioesterase family protein [Frankia sp. CNm7]|uniref:Thioesterase family protein n=1 Tax=Frankia nepalensis TaxID=1836974 RepID=A0A937RJT9_9ACTN|nr:acyl-CoA thioesterase domain-containing protein [Frankia nepalensis]MBL7500195.1 thioesterase family protein [Frankia nepalensis]MBL7509425.1 thioesterase family protein [Frankia nepalensis]MBL7522763.1 thioesterase family protein [Frankia nepalensis]MBL7631625.1 thioesterase family protein [Frankia nepalensis]
MFTVDAVLGSLVLEPVGEDLYRANSIPSPNPVVVFGGQLLAQSIAAALAGQNGKTVKTLHTVFARPGRPDTPLDIAVTRLHSGRSMASSAVTISQGGKVISQSTVLLSADDPDFIRHGDTRPGLEPPKPGAEDTAGLGGHGGQGADDPPGTWQVSVVGGVDISDPEAVGPAELDVWTRWPGAPDDAGSAQALLAFGTDGFLIGTAMRPHAGVGQAQAHRTISTGVLSHTITFHEPIPAGDWLLLAHRSPYAGRGRGYGHGDVFRADGGLVASFVQDSMIRPMAPASAGTHRL